jgi:tol-pal system protein YbgF
MYKHLLAVALIAAVSSSQAQVRVVESSPQSVRSGVGSIAPANVGMQTDVLSEIQALKFEIATLRGLVEEQAHEISRLKQQQTENYLDLDTRLSGLSGAGAAISPNISPSVTPSDRALVTASPSTSGGSDAEVYAAAYDLLRQRQYDAAIVALNDYLTRFPNGAYAGNSYYWLGEIYLLKEELTQARDWFDKLLTNFPNDRKVSDAKFKLGKVHHLLGDNEKAKVLLSEVAAGTGDAARLAKQYLLDNF